MKSRRLRWAGHVARMCSQNARNAYKILRGTPIGRPRRRWKDNIRTNLREISIITKNLVDSSQDRDYWRALVNAALNLRDV